MFCLLASLLGSFGVHAGELFALAGVSIFISYADDLYCLNNSFEVLYITVRIAIERLENIGNVFEGMHIGLQIGNLGLTTFNS